MDLDLDDLVFHRILGRGALGTVFLVSLPPTHDQATPPPPPFALKVVDPSSTSSPTSSHRRSRWEISVLSNLPAHPFLPHLLSHLDRPPLLAAALPFCSGGDLNSLRLLQPDHLFPTSSILFYSSELLSALHHLHSHGIVYRDLKPENVLIQSTGHLTLSDFDLSHYLPPLTSHVDPFPPLTHPNPRRRRRGGGFLSRLFQPSLGKTKSARVCDNRPTIPTDERGRQRLYSFVGTEEYVSPEVVRGDGHDFMVDWWAFGVLLYEMAYGRTPFRGKNRKETFRNVLTREPEFAGGRRTELTDLIGRLLEKDPNRRLGSRGGGEEVKRHPFFKGVKWEILPELIRPPYVPPPCDDVAGQGEGIDIWEWLRKRKEGGRVKVGSLPTSPRASVSASLSEF